jgi:acetyltransferase-like isoleucine patch superfamily enzyme
MIFKNFVHRSRLLLHNLVLMWRYDVLIERGVTTKYIDSIQFGKHVTVQSGCYLYGSRFGYPVRFGDYTALGPGVVVLGDGGFELGDYSHFGPRVVVTTQYGDSKAERLKPDASLKYAPVRIGRGSWIGSGSVIMPGTVLGECSIVAPHSVVFGKWPAGVQLAGNPARPTATAPVVFPDVVTPSATHTECLP